MLKKVQIIEKSSGCVKIQFSLNLADDVFTQEDYITDAWNKGIVNGVLNADQQENYKIEVFENTPNK
ncbi:hypothetical protein [Nitrosomonas supralitoralis]|uniref:Uncharacterized protein n=1 Tax=Nitrosomonas supralitoralis TaxID=2116706 RepID=A0A2P7NV74_9PROT|nr:hypothetical protein [Nitrosomonas supralitoralis]PSJ17325.1 hypothetical protein C7H79_08505 [Nitrosomonas supralitoralis]